MKTILVVFLALACVVRVSAAIHAEAVEYHDGAAVLDGWLAYDDTVTGPRPGVLVVHQWKGLGDYEKRRCEMLAKLGYVALAADIYGKGIRPQDPQAAGKEAGKYKVDRAPLRTRVQAGLATLKNLPQVDPQRVAAIGYCFGGTAVLELARSGADIAGVVSFHGGLDSPNPAAGKNIKCKVLVLHGANDPHVSAKDLAAFEAELRDAGVDWQLIKYSGAVHAFTDPGSGNDPSRGVAYNAVADRRSWAHMQQFFDEIIPGTKLH